MVIGKAEAVSCHLPLPGPLLHHCACVFYGVLFKDKNTHKLNPVLLRPEVKRPATGLLLRFLSGYPSLLAPPTRV